MVDKVNLHPYAAAILHYLKGEKVEINGGDVQSTLKFSDYDYTMKSIIIGVVEDAMGDCLIINKDGTRIFLNVWGIKSIVPYRDDLYLKDVYQDDEFRFRRK